MSTDRARTLQLDPVELLAELSAGGPGRPGEPTVVIVPADDEWPPVDVALAGTPAVIVGVSDRAGVHPRDHPGSAWCDVVLQDGDDQLSVIAANVARTPLAAAAVAQVLRGSETRSLADGLLLESAVYSTLQAGPEFAAWRASTPVRRRADPGEPPVLLERRGDHLAVTLNRPHVRNALNTAMRDALVEAFHFVALDKSITEVTLRGSGSDFCSGGDLDEFGSFTDPASAHVVRQVASAGRALSNVARRVRATLHGACVGSGIELPAFAGTLLLDPSARVGLPEVRLGLIPGAGGTWSLPQRIGRHRTALLALTCEPIAASTAIEWGLGAPAATDLGDRTGHR